MTATYPCCHRPADHPDPWHYLACPDATAEDRAHARDAIDDLEEVGP